MADKVSGSVTQVVGESASKPLALWFEIPASIYVRRASRSARVEEFLFACIQPPKTPLCIFSGKPDSDTPCILPLRFPRERLRDLHMRIERSELAGSRVPAARAGGRRKVAPGKVYINSCALGVTASMITWAAIYLTHMGENRAAVHLLCVAVIFGLACCNEVFPLQAVRITKPRFSDSVPDLHIANASVVNDGLFSLTYFVPRFFSVLSRKGDGLENPRHSGYEQFLRGQSAVGVLRVAEYIPFSVRCVQGTKIISDYSRWSSAVIRGFHREVVPVFLDNPDHHPCSLGIKGCLSIESGSVGTLPSGFTLLSNSAKSPQGGKGSEASNDYQGPIWPKQIPPWWPPTRFLAGAVLLFVGGYFVIEGGDRRTRNSSRGWSLLSGLLFFFGWCLLLAPGGW